MDAERRHETAEPARELLRAWLADLPPDLRRAISTAGVEPQGQEWTARVILLPGHSPESFPPPPEGLPLRYDPRVLVFCRLIEEHK